MIRIRNKLKRVCLCVQETFDIADPCSMQDARRIHQKISKASLLNFFDFLVTRLLYVPCYKIPVASGASPCLQYRFLISIFSSVFYQAIKIATLNI